MNTVLLQYAVEVEKTGSITQAANNLFMDQPNLSKAIKTLEESMGAPIFKRTSKGVVPTSKGKIFLEHARSVLTQLDEMEALYKPEKKHREEFRLSIPRASYISYAFSRFVGKMAVREGISVWLRETNSLNTIKDLEYEEYHLGVIRYPVETEKYYLQLLKDKGLEFEPVWSYQLRLLLSEHHPLAGKSHITLAELAPYTEITHGDVSFPAVTPDSPVQDGEGGAAPGRIYVFERGSQFNLLQMNPDTYMWVSPMPEEILKRQGLVERPCAAKRPCRDLLIWRKGCRKTRWDLAFEQELRQVKGELEQSC